MKLIPTLILGTVIALSGCATTYQTDGRTGGQAPKWRAADILEIQSRGNGYTSSKKLNRMTLLRAAETAIEANYRYFIEVGSENKGGNHKIVLPSTQTTTFNQNYNPTGFTGTSTTMFNSGVTNIYKPGVDAVYKMYEELPENARPGQYHDAYEIYNRLGKKYARKFKPKTPPA